MSPLDCDTAFTNCFFMSLQEDSGTQFPVKFRVLTYEITKDCLLCVAFVSTGQSAEEISKESFDSPQLKKTKQKKNNPSHKKDKRSRSWDKGGERQSAEVPQRLERTTSPCWLK